MSDWDHSQNLVVHWCVGCFCILFRLTVLAVVFAVLMACAAQAQFIYTTNNGTITIIGYTSTNDDVVIPNAINDLPVTELDQAAFAFNTNVTQVTIPESLTLIGNGPFAGCSALTNIAVDSRNPIFTSVDGVLFAENQTTLLQYPGGKTGSYLIPNTVTSIADSAFQYCLSLTSVTMGNSVISIGDFAFANTGLISVTIPNSAISIGDGAFSWTCLTNVTIGSSVIRIGPYAFVNECTSLTAISVETNNQAYSSVGGVLFNRSQTTLTQFPGGRVGSYSIPNSVTSIGDGAFYYCTNLTSVTIPNGVTSIGSGAFGNCISLASVVIPNTVTDLEEFTFTGCFSLTNVIIGNSVTSIFGAFQYCTNLTTINIPNSVTSIGSSAFQDCTSLASVDIPNSVTSIGINAFNYCTNLTSITIPNSVTSIGIAAFSDCTNLTSANIPNKVTSIGHMAFSGTGLTKITIPASVTDIGFAVFSRCWGLTKVFFEGNAPAVGLDPFDDSFAQPVVAHFDPVTVYFLPGTSGWSTNFAGVPTAIWTPEVLTDARNFGLRTNQFGFNIIWADGRSVVVEASPSMGNPVWSAVATNVLSGGTFYFTDPQRANYPSRFYRVRSQ